MSSRKGRKRSKQSLQAPSLGRAQIVVEPPGVERMSEVLEEFADPYIPPDGDEQVTRHVLLLAAAAWNLAFLPDETLAEEMCNLVGRSAPGANMEARLDLLHLLTDMVERKRAHFAANCRSILSVEVRATPTGLHLLVKSTLPPQTPST